MKNEYNVYMDGWIKSALVLVAVAVVGFLGSWEASGLFSARGGFGPTILQAQSPISAVVSVLITVGVASIIGGFVGRYTTTLTGMFILGFALFAMAMKLDGIDSFIYSKSNVHLLIVEAFSLSALIYVATLVLFAISGPLKDVQKPEEGQQSNFWKILLISLSVIPVVYLVAKTPMRGQVIGAVAVGGVVIGFLARQFTPMVQPKIYYVLPIAAGGLGYFLGNNLGPVSDVALVQGTLSPLLFPMPIEFASGLIIGLSIGLGLAASLAEKPPQETVTQVTA
jgi:hypothetical protein